MVGVGREGTKLQLMFLDLSDPSRAKMVQVGVLERVSDSNDEAGTAAMHRVGLRVPRSLCSTADKMVISRLDAGMEK